jgi:hypothetical protein
MDKQNQNQQEVLECQDSKKTWVEPEMSALSINGGIVGGIYEKSTSKGMKGSMS